MGDGGRCSNRQLQQLPSAGSLLCQYLRACQAACQVRGEQQRQEYLSSVPSLVVSICSESLQAWLALAKENCQQA